jgi:hypothetical protein
MSVLRFSIDLVSKSMSKDILFEYVNHISGIFNVALPFIRSKTTQIVTDTLRASDAWGAINGGELQEIFKIPSPSSALYAIEQAIVNSMDIVRTPVTIAGQSVNGSFSVNLLDDSYRDVLNANNTSFVTTNGKPINWLEWLLFYGNSAVASKAKLIETDKGVFLVRANTDLYVPSAYSGIPNDNILTRALVPAEAAIGQMIEDEMSRRA